MIIGLVGKPSTGKSTFFKACTLAEVEIAPYPFTTIEKNEGVGFVRVECVEKEFNVRCKPKFGYCLNGYRFIPIKLIDVAGLIEGSHLGRGRGNQFLDDLRQADLLINIVDVSGSTNEKGEIVRPLSYDPCKDVRMLENEIDMWFYSILLKNWSKFIREVKQDKKELKKEITKQFSGLKITEEMVEDVVERVGDIEDEENLKRFACELRKRSKPIIIAANKIDINGCEKNLEKLKKEFPDYLVVACSAESELALREASKNKLIDYIPGERDFKVIGDLNEKQKKALEFIKENVLSRYGSGVQDVLNKAVFGFLNYIVVYPVENENKLSDSSGNILPDAHLLKKGSTCLDLAYKIHTDIGDKFLYGIDIRSKKRVGRDYELKNNDIVKIISV